ncbi:MAG: hypothetical protein R3B13_36010 [Polyangiaceae bacterium]
MAAVNYDLVSAARRVIEGALAVVPGERVVVIGDRERRELSEALAEAGTWAKARVEVYDLDAFGAHPLLDLPQKVAAAMAQAQASVFVARAGSEEVALRRRVVELAQAHGLRHAHMLGLTARTMTVGLAVDPHRIADTARLLRARLRPDSVIRVTSRAGTDLTVVLEPRNRWVENSGIIRAGRWLNLPAGELLTSPGSVKGVFAANASVTGIAGLEGRVLSGVPLLLRFDGQRAVAAECADSRARLAVEDYLRGGANYDRVGLVSFGTNVGLSEPSGTLIVDQTLPGLHLALGMSLPDLTGADWDSAGQLVLTASQASIDIDGAVVMREGRYLL